ncbi:hypothetical protein ODJ79_01975 [Actinoplanes sp. KI2]|uniref:hypothetical protein n=1 Tax=Actinoplanes sp. KI2 TaxID=2983315 RepID=UPI0021D5FCAE|nr:hypothetical protein [Actinoplanes sp. KI2]MCU7722472.1 hypothetical protein [Actinoplanes sp. KI2]
MASFKEQIVFDVTGWTESERAELLAAHTAVQNKRAAAAAADEQAAHGGWTGASRTLLLSRLTAAGANVVAQSFAAALASGGYVTRDKVYELGNYPADRVLKGFTRPINRIVAEMRASGEIPSDAVDPFVPAYDQVTGRAIGFRVAPEIVALG